MNGEKLLDISWETIFKIAFAFFFFYFIYLVRDILTLIFFAFIISLLFNPAINFFQKRKISRIFATILIYFFVFGIFSFFIYSIFPLIISEFQQFLQLFPQYFEKLSPPLRELGFEAFENLEVFTKAFGDWLIKVSKNILSAIATIFGGIFSAFAIFTLAIFFSLEEKGLEKAIVLIFPKKYQNYILEIWQKSQEKISGWFFSRILACLFVGLLTLIASKILDLKYAFSFAILAGITNILPVIGPIFAGIIIFFFTFFTSFWKAIFILISFILIQQIENNILTPILTKKIIGLPPILVLISLMIGGRLWGILGAILAIPLAGIIFEFSKEFLERKANE